MLGSYLKDGTSGVCIEMRFLFACVLLLLLLLS